MKKGFGVQKKVIATLSLSIVLLMMSSGAKSEENAVTATVKTAPVTQKEMYQKIVAYGTILPDADQVTTLSIPYSGQVEKVWVRPGQKVKKGDLLFSLNASPGEKMTFLQAEASVAFAKKELERLQELLSQHLATQAQVNAAKKNLEDAEIHLASLKKQGLDKNLQRFRAPQGGIVIQVNIQAGQRVQADTSAVQIAGDQQFEVRLGVEPEDLPSLREGQPVVIHSVFDQEKPFVSKVLQVHAMLNSATKLVDVIVPIPAEQSAHYVIGSHLMGEVLTDKYGAMVVPRSAVLSDEKGRYVFVNDQGVAKKIYIKIGQSTHDWVEVASGLNIHDRVIYLGNYELEPGMKVREEHSK